MAEIDNIFVKINISTHQLNMELILDVMNQARKQNKSNNKQNNELWEEICSILWKHLKNGLNKFDDQLLCATCFYTVMGLSHKQNNYLDELLEVIGQVIISKQKDCGVDSNITTLAVSIMYGLFQSSFLMQKGQKYIDKLGTMLEATFDLLVQMGYEYTQHTFIVFKTLRAFKKVCGTQLQKYIFSREKQIKLLNLVNHNWENPITGVRDQIKSIFQTLITTVDEEMFNMILKEINVFYWSKAKYLMLSEIIECSNDMFKIVLENNWVSGLIYSLNKPGLVSAGADMYYAVLKKTKSENEWSDMFLDSVNNILKGSSVKAVENFTNYWCLTTLKTFPNLLPILIDGINTETRILSNLYIMKQGNKLGLLDKNWDSIFDNEINVKENIIKYCLEDNNPQVRMLAFDIVCVSQGQKLPTKVEYQLILTFLYNNINTDCTVLRLSMLGSINYFLTQLHVTFLNNIKTHQDIDVEELYDFCKQLQELIIESLNLNGNYQRKITCIKLCIIALTGLSKIHRKRKHQTRQYTKPLIECLKEKQYWLLSKEDFVLKLISLLRDPADDVRDSVVNLLLNHYSMELKETAILNDLIENALKSMKSKFFYEISCGQTMFKLIANLLTTEVQDAKFKDVEEIFSYAYKELVNEYKFQRGIMKTIEEGKQLHSFINILLVVLETCISNSGKISLLDDSIHELADSLVGVANQFSWEEETSTSSDFSKMNDMVQDIIIKSGYNPCDKNDQTKISGLHQIVLNCLWLNVKASCDLASLLIQYKINDIDICKKCLKLITHVLETSRHKGVIEAAGAALGRGIQFLTSLPKESILSELPYTLLKTKLNELISEANKMASITRRGAGLSIMVHRIVANDTKKGKPLFHYFMKTLLETCNKVEDVPNMEDNLSIENQEDLPKALYIHFLTRIVIDSSLASDMMFYSTDLSALAFSQLTNPHWQIRNAALQLYGALVPKLIGQKKASGTDDETIATVACDELRTHSPKLWRYIIKELQNKNYKDKVLSHSNLVPILNMIANSAKRYNFSNDMKNQKDSDCLLLQSLVVLLGSPIYTVRRLTAKCIFNIFTLEDIFKTLSNLEYHTSENLLNGSLMLVQIIYKYCSSDYQEQFQNLKVIFSKIFSHGNHSYPSRETYENIFCNTNFNNDVVIKTFLEVSDKAHAPGIYIWAHARLRNYINNCAWNEIPRILKVVLYQIDYEKYCECVYEKIEACSKIPETTLKEIVEILISFDNKHNSSFVWKIVYKISLKIYLGNQIDVPVLFKNLDSERIYKLRYMIPFLATVVRNSDENIQIKFTELMFNLTNPDKADVDMRYVTALANNEIAIYLDKLTDPVRIISIKTAIVLLQDEDEDVRNVSVHFYKILSEAKREVHAYICLNKILDTDFLPTLFETAQESTQKLCNELHKILLSNISCTVDEYNPFANDSRNMYLEHELLTELIIKLKSIEF